MLRRIIFDIVTLICIWFFPWWLTLPLALGLFFFFSPWFEGLLFAVLFCLLFWGREQGTEIVFTLVAALGLFTILPVVKTKLR